MSAMGMIGASPLIATSPANAAVVAARCELATGTIVDPFGRGIANATVEIVGTENVCWDDPNAYPYRVTSAADGRFTVGVKRQLVPGTTFPVHVWPPSQWDQRLNVPIAATPVVGDQNTIALTYDILNRVSSPQPVRPGGTVVVDAMTAVPRPMDAPGGKVLAQMPGGAIIDLAPPPTASTSKQLWTGSWTVPAGTADGSYYFYICGVRTTYSGSCTGAPASELLTSTVHLRPYYIVDTTAPRITSTTPGRFATVQSLPGGAKVTWTDARLSIQSWTLQLDDAPVPFTASKGYNSVTLTIPASAIGPGSHRLTSTATDEVGNTASDAVMFTVASASADPADATLRSETVPVNPGGLQLPPPSTVTFAAPVADVGGFAERISGAGGAGIGPVSRAFTLSDLKVRFVNETGIPADVTPSLATVTSEATHVVASLSPSTTEVVAHIKPSVVTLPSLTAQVPPGYATAGSTAELLPARGPLGPPQAGDGGDPGSDPGWFEDALPRNLVGTGAIQVCGQAAGSALARCGGTPLVDIQVYVPGLNVPVATNSQLQPDEDAGEASPSPCTPVDEATTTHGCTGAPQEVESRGSFGCPSQRVNLAFYDLCTADTADGTYQPGFLAAYLHQYVYTAAGSGGFPVFDQSHVQAPAEGTPCSNGKPGRQRAKVERVATTISALDGQLAGTVGGTYRDDRTPGVPVSVRLGAETGPDHLSGVDGNGEAVPSYHHEPGLRFQIDNWYPLSPRNRNEGTYTVGLRAKENVDGVQVPDPTSVVNAWSATPGSSGVGGSVQLAVGTHYPGLAGVYAVQSVLAFKFTLEGC